MMRPILSIPGVSRSYLAYLAGNNATRWRRYCCLGGIIAAMMSMSSPQAALLYQGVNLASAGFAGNKLPGRYNTHYTYPDQSHIEYFHDKGMNTFRLAFRWERLQRKAYEDFNWLELTRLKQFVERASQHQAYTVLDVHNYARYYGNIIGSGDLPVSAFADFWAKLALVFRDNPKVIFGLMNEPHGMPTELWLQGANAAIKAIRDTGAKNLILVPGNAYSSAARWNSDSYGGANGQVMLGVIDPINHYAFEVHQYFDRDSSGTSPECVSGTIGSERLTEFTQWLRQHNQRGFLGEFGVSQDPTCLAALDDILNFIQQANQQGEQPIWLGWTIWAAGPRWGDYMFSIEPDNGVDKPQMAVLAPYLIE